MEEVVATEVDGVVQTSPAPEPGIIGAEDKEGMISGELVDESTGDERESQAPTASEMQNSGEITRASDESLEPQIVAQEVEARPSLESVWESLHSPAASQAGFEPQGNQSVASNDASPDLPQSVPEIKGRVRPSSLRTRPRTGAKRSVTFKDDFEAVKETEAHGPGGGKQAGNRRHRVPPGCLGLLLSIALASLVVYITSPNVPTKPRMWTSEELEKYNGTGNKPPLLLGILGSVFDVSKGWKHYGPGGSYHHFVGRDASRAFVSGNFTDDGLTDSLEGLTPSQIKAIDDWRLFFVSRYVYLGKLVGTFYNTEGLPTKTLYLAKKKIQQAAKGESQQKVDEERFPNCNSRWTQDQGGEVWCNEWQVPRIVEVVVPDGPRRGPPRTRCACLEPHELQRPGLKEYDGCDAESSKCKAS